MNWSETNSYLKGICNKLDELSDPVRIASFDLDDTLIHRPKGKLSNNKWKLLDLNVCNKIADLIKNNFIIIIFTNQSSMYNGKNFDKPKWRKAIEDLVKILMSKVLDNKYYFAVYVAKTYDLYRKPNIGMWELMKIDLKDEFGLNKIRISNKSFFCGDAAGRISASTFKKKLYPRSKIGDFSDTDIKFALNIGIHFLTPEEFFLKNAPKLEYKLKGINPTKLLGQLEKCSDEYEFIPRKKEMILMVGPQGSGKTEFVKKYILPHGYVHVNQDTCKTKVKCITIAKEALEKGKSIVIDNTNPNITSRYPYISLAQDHGYKHIRAIIMNTDDIIAKHLNNVRHVYSNGQIPRINNIIYNVFRKNYVKPNLSEHFDKIDTVDFIFDPEQLNDPLWKKIFLRWSEA
jgi:bifunctional polynucleotide phosphatase/kinase